VFGVFSFDGLIETFLLLIEIVWVCDRLIVIKLPIVFIQMLIQNSYKEYHSQMRSDLDLLMPRSNSIELLVINTLIYLLVEFLKGLSINIIHQNLVPASTDVLEPLGTEFLQHKYNLCELLLRHLFESLVETVLLAQGHLLDLRLLL
jgi:hypothetical protein